MALTLSAVNAQASHLNKKHLGEYSCRVTGVLATDASILESSLSPNERKRESCTHLTSEENPKETMSDNLPKVLNLAMPSKRYVDIPVVSDMPLDLTVRKDKVSPAVPSSFYACPLDLSTTKEQDSVSVVKKSNTTNNMTATSISKSSATYVCDNLFDLKMKIKRSKSETPQMKISPKAVTTHNLISSPEQINPQRTHDFLYRRKSCEVASTSNSITKLSKFMSETDDVVFVGEKNPSLASRIGDLSKSFISPTSTGARKRRSPLIISNASKVKKTCTSNTTWSTMFNNEKISKAPVRTQHPMKYSSQHRQSMLPLCSPVQTTAFVPNVLKYNKVNNVPSTTHSTIPLPHSKHHFQNLPTRANMTTEMTKSSFLTPIKVNPSANHYLLTSSDICPHSANLIHPSLLRPKCDVNNVKKISKQNVCVRSPPGGISIVSTPLNQKHPMTNAGLNMEKNYNSKLNNSLYAQRMHNVVNSGYGSSKMYRTRQAPQMTIDVNEAVLAARALQRVSNNSRQSNWNPKSPPQHPLRTIQHPYSVIAPNSHIQPSPQYNGRNYNSLSSNASTLPTRGSAIEESSRCCIACQREAYYLCSGCKSMWYCSKHCQLEHWKIHSTGCSELKQLL